MSGNHSIHRKSARNPWPLGPERAGRRLAAVLVLAGLLLCCLFVAALVVTG